MCTVQPKEAVQFLVKLTANIPKQQPKKVTLNTENTNREMRRAREQEGMAQSLHVYMYPSWPLSLSLSAFIEIEIPKLHKQKS